MSFLNLFKISNEIFVLENILSISNFHLNNFNINNSIFFLLSLYLDTYIFKLMNFRRFFNLKFLIHKMHLSIHTIICVIFILYYPTLTFHRLAIIKNINSYFPRRNSNEFAEAQQSFNAGTHNIFMFIVC